MRRIWLLLPALCASLLTASPSVSQVELIAHRGESADAPENTLAALQLAWQRGVPTVELDVHLTRDGALVLSHDPNTRRTTGVGRVIRESTLQELRRLDAGRWKGPQWAGERMPTLEEALATIPERGRCFIEIKEGPDVVAAVARAVRASGKRPEQLAIISFNLETVAEAKRQLPEIRAYYLASFRQAPETGAWSPTIDELIAQARSARADGLDLSFRGPVDREAIRRIKAAGLEFYVWTVNDAEVARRMAADGAHGITTDRAAWLRTQLAASPPAPALPAAPAPIATREPIRTAAPDVLRAVGAFYAYDRATPLQAEVVARQDLPGHTREKIVFTGVRPVRVPAYLALPKNRMGPFPVVILIDGITGSKERWFQEDSWPRGTLVSQALLDSGIAVLSLDARYHGERGAENDYRPPQLTGAAFRDMFVPSVIEHRRAMDYLATRPEVDTTRIGALGLSMGGMMTLALAATDGRIRAGVAGVTPVGAFRDPDAVTVAPQTFAGGIRDTPMLLQMGRTDGFYTVEEAEQFFALIPSPRKELVWYDSGHRLPAEYAERAVSWLRTHLR